MKKIVLAALVLALPAVATAQQAEKKPPVQVTAQLDRTALWVGDDLHYTIRAVYDPNVEMVLDNFTRERLPLSPFIIRDIGIRHTDWASGKKAVEIALTLTTFETGKGDLTIPLVPLYYFVREAGTVDKERPVDSIAAPPMPVGLRSALVSETLTPRTTKPAPGPGLLAALLPLGLGLAGFAGVSAYGARRLWRRMHPETNAVGLSREARERIIRDAAARLHAEADAAGDDPRQWSGAMASALRGMIGELFQAPAAAQTPEEIEATLTHAGADASLAAQTRTLLHRSDDLRYGREPAAPGQARPEMLQAFDRLMRSPRWVTA